MSLTRKIYLLDPKHLSPETIAVTFAKTSRSPQSFNEIASELSEEKSADFNEKWVVGYGHSSVAEHAVLHIAVENISRLAVTCCLSKPDSDTLRRCLPLLSACLFPGECGHDHQRART